MSEYIMNDYEQIIIKIKRNNTLVMFRLEYLSEYMSIFTNGLQYTTHFELNIPFRKILSE